MLAKTSARAHTTHRYDADGKLVPFTDIVLEDLADEKVVIESEWLRVHMPCQWSEVQAQVKPGTFATLGFGELSTPFGMKSVTAGCAVPQHLDIGDVACFIGWYHLGKICRLVS